MAETQHSAAAAHDAQTADDLVVSAPCGGQYWELRGTRAQLEAEGVIPIAAEWPAPGKQVVKWTARPLAFSLQRTRPADGGGPGRRWLSGDWWLLTCAPVGGVPDWRQQRVIDARRELQAALYDLSPAARQAELDLFQRSHAAGCDGAFQAFKALIPALNPVSRGRRAGGAAG